MSEKVRMVCAGIYALDVPRCFDVVVMKVWCYCTNSNLWLSKARELYQMQIWREVTITLVKRMMLYEQIMGRELCKWRGSGWQWFMSSKLITLYCKLGGFESSVTQH